MGTPSDRTNGVTFFYGGGRASYLCGRDRQTTIYCDCDLDYQTPTIVNIPYENPTNSCSYFIGMKAAGCCKKGSEPSPCPTTVDGTEYPNLPSLTLPPGQDYKSIGQDGKSWTWNICSTETTIPNCGTPNTVVCHDISNGAYRSCGTTDVQSISMGTPSDRTNGVTFFYGGGRASYLCGRDRQTTIYCDCDLDYQTPTIVNIPYENPTNSCSYFIGMKAAGCCKKGGSEPSSCPTTVDGVNFPQLNKLTATQSPSYHAKSSQGDSFYWNFCSTESGLSCDLTPSAVCQDAGFGTGFSCGLVTNQKITSGTSKNTTNGVTFRYSGGSASAGCGRDRQTTIEVFCNQTATTPMITSPPTEIAPCLYHISMQSSFACADASSKFSCCMYSQNDKVVFQSCAKNDECIEIPPYRMTSKGIDDCNDCLETF